MPHFWEIIFFIIALIIFVKTVLPRIKKMIDDHIENISRSLKEAENLRKEAQTMLEQAYVEWKKTEEHHVEILALAQEEIKVYKEHMRAKTDNMIMQRERQAEERISLWEREVIKNLINEIVYAASASVIRVLQKDNIILNKQDDILTFVATCYK